MNAGGICIPDGQEKPYVMVGLGTGIAPFRAMIQDRQHAKNQGEKTGPMALFFGNRHKKTEFLYGEEFENEFKSILTNTFYAWSRDQKEKV